MAHWSRQDLKKNELEEFLVKAVAWVELNRKKVLGAAGAALLAILLGALVYYHKTQLSNSSWERLNLAETYAYAGRPDLSARAVQELNEAYPASTASEFGLLFSADLDFWRGRYDEALKLYSGLLSRGRPSDLMPVALAGQAFAYMGAGKMKEAADAERRFLDSYPDHFLAPHVHEEMVRTLLALGEKEKAKSALERIALEYPGTPWAARAQKALEPPAPAKAPKTAGKNSHKKRKK